MKLEPDEEAALVAKVKEGDQEAFGTLIEHLQDPIYHLVFRQINNENDALDICQDVFLKAFHKIELFRGDSRLSTWITRIAINECRNFFRKKQNQKKSVSSDQLELVSDTPPDQDLLEKERKKHLYQALSSLDPTYSQVIILYHLQSKAHKEISKILNIPIGTVKTRLHRGLKLLAKKLKPSNFTETKTTTKTSNQIT